MQLLTIKQYGNGKPDLFRAWHARTLWQRLRGLIARPALKAGEGLLITPCNSVHTIGMRYPLDLVFLDQQGSVVKCVPDVKSNRLAAARKARHALELPVGSIAEARIAVGDRLDWTEIKNMTASKSSKGAR